MKVCLQEVASRKFFEDCCLVYSEFKVEPFIELKMTVMKVGLYRLKAINSREKLLTCLLRIPGSAFCTKGDWLSKCLVEVLSHELMSS